MAVPTNWGPFNVGVGPYKFLPFGVGIRALNLWKLLPAPVPNKSVSLSSLTRDSAQHAT